MIVILGTGQVGSAVFYQIQNVMPETEVLLVNRSGKVDFKIPASTKVIGLDVTVTQNLIEVFAKAELVFSCTDVPYSDWGSFYPDLTRSMIAGLKHSNAKLVFADNMYSYGNLKGKLIHEGLSHFAKTKKGKIRADLIRELNQSGFANRIVIVKSSDFTGPGIVKGLFGVDFLHQVYGQKKVNLPGMVTLPHHFTFISDFAKAMVIVGMDREAFGQIWHVPNAPAVSQTEWLRLFSQHTGIAIRYRTIPKMVIRVVGLFNSFVKELLELAYQFEFPYLIQSQKFIAKYGDISTPLEEQVIQTIAWYKSTVLLPEK